MSLILIFIYFFLLGIILGLIYDFFKILRIFIQRNIFIFFIDILYFIICSLFTFVLLVYLNSGIIRCFIFQAEFFGFILYKYTFNKIFFVFMRKIILNIKNLNLFIFNNNRNKKWDLIIFCDQKNVIFFYIFMLFNWKSSINNPCPILTNISKVILWN